MQGEAGREVLREAVGSGEYFLVMLPDGTRMVHPITRGIKHPLAFGREVGQQLLSTVKPGGADQLVTVTK